jgi:hypothetical protein
MKSKNTVARPLAGTERTAADSFGTVSVGTGKTGMQGNLGNLMVILRFKVVIDCLIPLIVKRIRIWILHIPIITQPNIF